MMSRYKKDNPQSKKRSNYTINNGKMTTRGAAKFYYNMGWTPIPVHRGGKNPKLDGWSSFRIATINDIKIYFDPSDNIGILLGKASGGLVDIDLDHPLSVKLAPYFLLPTKMVSGRKSNPGSHHWYLCNPPPAKGLKFTDPDRGGVLVELRSMGQQTLVPPSIHPTKEPYQWLKFGEPPRVNISDLLQAVKCLVAATMIAIRYTRGGRHELILPLAGFLLKNGMIESDVSRFIQGIATVCNDREINDRLRVVKDTAAKVDQGEPVSGGPTLAKQWGNKVVHQLASLLNLKEKDSPAIAEQEVRNWLEQGENGNADIRHIVPQLKVLATHDNLAYEQLRSKVAKKAAIRCTILDQIIKPENNNEKKSNVIFVDVEPHPQPVDGAQLLDEISRWFSQYVVLPRGGADAIAAWAVATWFVDQVYFAPLLALLSPTCQVGKTMVLELLKPIVHRPQPSQGAGITPAVLFRLNQEWHPTFLIDEAEKLAGLRDGSQELIGLLNSGHRQGAKVLRCTGEDYHIEAFDAFGFRAVAAIGRLWETLLDRAIILDMQRRSPEESIKRFEARVVQADGEGLARKIARWVQDHRDDISQAEAHTPRPEGLSDRACDNWSPLFAVATLAGGGWLNRLLEAAEKLEKCKKQEIHGEKLILDIQAIFNKMGNPEVIPSGELVAKLNKIETWSWGEYKGSGLTTHKLARELRKFNVQPKQRRTTDNRTVRGYWFQDLELVFSRYTPPQTGTTGTSLKTQQLTATQSGTGKSDEIAVNDSKQRDVPVVPLQTGTEGTPATIEDLFYP